MANRANKNRYNPSGPAVILGTASSIFTQHLASYWQKSGMDVVLVTNETDISEDVRRNIKVISRTEYTSFSTKILRKIELFLLRIYPFVILIEKAIMRLYRGSYQKSTGKANAEQWEAHLFGNIYGAFPVSKVALSLKPRFVFGQEVAAYGLATVLCRKVPRILFPWGADIFWSAELYPLYFRLIQYSLKHADLIVPSSATAARHICKRFNIPDDKVHAVSWGVDRKMFTRSDDAKRRELCAKFRINPASLIILNSRRFLPLWGCFIALEAFMQVAQENPDLHFVMIGGLGVEQHTSKAREILESKGLLSRFIIFDKDIPLSMCAELMSISDIFVSLPKSDMRSWTVLQGASSGAVPVISDLPEYREMMKDGFDGILVNPESVDEVLNALRQLINDPDLIKKLRNKNNQYIELHEDHDKQMNILLELINGVCSRYEHGDN